MLKSPSMIQKIALALRDKVRTNLTSDAIKTNEINDGLKLWITRKLTKGIEPSKVNAETAEIIRQL